MYRHSFRFLIPAVALFALASACSRDPEVAKREYVASGDKYAEQGKYKEAIVQYRNAVQQDPRYGAARLKLADAYARNSEPVNASGEYIRAADLLPDNDEAQLSAGAVLLLAGRFDDAKARAKTVLERNPRNVQAQVLLGNAMARLKDLDGAIAQIEEAIKIDPGRGPSYSNLGALRLEKGNAKEAEIAFKKAVEVDGKSAWARLALANFYWSSGRSAETEATLKQALEIDPRNILTQRVVAAFYLTSGRPAEAEAPLQRVADISQASFAQLALADYYLATSRTQQAEQIFNRLTSDSKREISDVAKVRLAAIAFRANRPADGHKLLDNVLAKNQNYVPALIMKADILIAGGKPAEALPRIKTALSADPRSAQAQFMLGKVSLALNLPEDAVQAFNETLRLNPRAAQAQVELARLRLASGDNDTSVRLAQEAAAIDPSSEDAQLVLAQGLLAQRDIPRAGAVIENLLAKYPRSAVVHTNAAMLAVLKGDRAAARKALDRAEQLDPEMVEPFRGQVQLDLVDKNLDAARARIETRLARTPRDARALTVAASAYAQMGDGGRAEQVLRTAVEADPSYLPAYALLGQMYLSQRKLDQARAELQNVAARQAKPVGALTMVGIIDEMQKKPADARKVYERVVEMSPQAAVAANNLAWLYAEAGENLDVALRLAQGAKSHLPDNPEVNDTLGWIYYKKGLATLAVPAFRLSIEKSPSNPLFHYHLGLAYASAGDKRQARLSLERALKLNSDFEGAVEARKALSALSS